MYPKDENKVLNLFENLDKNMANFRIRVYWSRIALKIGIK
jgi:3'-phosphoadenosine 5'-phosphosulfate sulfotransferase